MLKFLSPSKKTPLDGPKQHKTVSTGGFFVSLLMLLAALSGIVGFGYLGALMGQLLPAESWPVGVLLIAAGVGLGAWATTIELLRKLVTQQLNSYEQLKYLTAQLRKSSGPPLENPHKSGPPPMPIQRPSRQR